MLLAKTTDLNLSIQPVGWYSAHPERGGSEFVGDAGQMAAMASSIINCTLF